MPDRVDLDLANNFLSKPIRQEVSSQIRMDSARLEIKQLVLFYLPNSCAVRALHIVCQDFQLRLRINSRFIGKQQVFVRLHRVGLLSVMPHEDFAVEDSSRFSVKNSLVKLVAGAMRLAMIDD